MPPPLPSPRTRERSSIPRPGSGGSASAFRVSDSDAKTGSTTPRQGPAAGLTRTSSTSSVGANRENIRVTVRLRPFSNKERKRGDREVWSIVANNTVGLTQAIGARIKYAFDTVLGQHINNTQVYQVSCADIVASTLDGYNGTVFAYGVTSSGKTHTILGDDSDPGIVQRALQDIFAAVARSHGRDFLLALSMLEIYNEDLKDLLDPGRILKLREDAKRGFFVEGAKEEILLSPEHALAVMAHGQQHRTVSSTMFNECSSRSHTIIRLRIESSSHGSSAGPATRSLSHLNFIDLAGSESAKVVLSKGHSKEGSYINRSLLTLSTVIAKLADGNAVHIPYRDSRLTRLLQNSLSGVGAKIAVIATITPASSQAEETHNTLKFATRAKRIEIRAERNEATDTSSLLIRYQLEIANLRSQLEQLQSRGLAPRGSLPDPLHPEIRNLREQLEEERHALSARDADKAVLEQRILRLTRLVLSSARATAAATRTVAAPRRGHTRTTSDVGSVRRPQIASEEAAAQHDRRSGDVEAACAQVVSAGELIPGSGAMQLQQAHRPSYDWDREALCDQVVALTDELEARAKQLEILQRAMHSARSMSGDVMERKESLPLPLSHERNMSLPIAHMRHSSMDQQRLQHETDIQMLAAEREFMAGQLKSASLARSRLQAHVAALQRQLREAGMQPCEAPHLPVQLPSRSRTTSRDAEGDADGFESARHSYQDMLFTPGNEAPKSPFDSTEAPTPTGSTPLPTPGRAKFTADVIDRLGQMEGEVSVAVSEAERREAVMLKQRHALQQAQVELDSLRSQAQRLSGENTELRAEAQRLELQDGHLQGYGLDDMANEQLASLIVTLIQAVERVRVTVQLRRVQAAGTAASPRPAPKPPMPTSHAGEGTGAAYGQPPGRLDTVAAGKLIEAREKLREARHSMASEPGSGSLDALPRGSMELEASEDNVPGRSWTLLLSDSRGSGCTTSGTSPFTRADSTDPPFIPTDPTPVHPQGRKSHEEVVTEAAQQLAQGQQRQQRQQRQERQERQERQQRALAQALAASPPRPKAAQPSAPPEEQLPPEETDSASQLGNDPPRSHRISDDNMSLSAESSAPSLTSGRATPDRGRRGLLNVYGSYDGT